MLRVLIVAVALCLTNLAGAQALQPVPALSARVVDQTATLSADQRQRLASKLAAFEAGKGVQIAVLIVASVAPETIEQYALRVVESWQLGRKNVDDGALLLVAKQDRKLRIEVGYGLEGALNDATAKRIISETIAPRFKDGDFYGGINSGVDAMIQVVSGESLPPPAARSSDVGVDLETLVFVGFILVFVVGGILRAMLGRLLAAGEIGTVAAIIASLLVSSLLLGVLAGIVAFVVSLFAGASGVSGLGGMGGGWSSGGRGGGFSGGGGSFGGGGASGGW